MTEDLRAPFRQQFDSARDPYTARNALGIPQSVISGGGGGGGAPIGAEYIVSATDPTLTAERVLTNTASITWDFTTPGQAKANSAAGGGNVSNSGTPTLGQYAKWVTATTIQGVSAATVLGDIGAQPAGNYQPLDADLTSLAAASATGVIYYRSAANTWATVTVGTGLSFIGGTLTCTVSTAGSQPLDATLTALAAYNTNGLLTQTAADTFTGRTITGPAAGITVSNGDGVAGNPTLALANDLASLEAASSTNAIYYRSSIDTWAPVTIGGNMSFAGGTLNAVAGSSVADVIPQCGLLTLVSGTQLKFAPYAGDRIKINGVIYAIPSAGIAGLSATGLTANTLYYVYVFNSSGTLTGEFSTTGHATSTTAGNVGTEIKSGDDTRTLIGIVYTLAGPTFSDSTTTAYVRSWFNRSTRALGSAFTAFSTTSASWVSTSIGLNWVQFANECMTLIASGYAQNTATASNNYFGMALDGLTPPGIYTISSQGFANYYNPLNTAFVTAQTEGRHFVILYIQQAGTTMSGNAVVSGALG